MPNQIRNAVVCLHGVRKSYRTASTVTEVLKDIDFAVFRGEFVFLVGPSGSGKSTLLSILGAMLSPTAGSVFILGRDLLALNNQARTELRLNHIGFVFQRFHLIRGLNVQENVGLPLTLRGWSAANAQARARSLLQEVGLSDRASEMPRNLSTGQCQRVALARALVGDPDLILADEPTASLDASNGQAVIELLRDLTKSAGKTAIVVTHDERILHFADRVCVINNGRLLQKPRRRESEPVAVS